MFISGFTVNCFIGDVQIEQIKGDNVVEVIFCIARWFLYLSDITVKLDIKKYI